MSQMKKHYVLVIISLIFICYPNFSFAEESSINQILKTQEDTFGISDFIKESKKYTSENFKDIDFHEIFNSAISGNVDNKGLINRLLKLFGANTKETLKTAISILIIILLHSILKTFTEDLNNSEISKIIYYVQYILIVTVIMNSFSDVYISILDTIRSLVGFSNLLIPILITLMTYTGSITTSSIVQPILLFLIQFISKIIESLVMPIVSIIVVISIVSKISEKIQVEKISKFMKSSIVWFLGISITRRNINF